MKRLTREQFKSTKTVILCKNFLEAFGKARCMGGIIDVEVNQQIWRVSPSGSKRLIKTVD